MGFFLASALWSYGVLLPVTVAHAFITPTAVKSVIRDAGAFPMALCLCAVYALALETLVDLQKFIWCAGAIRCDSSPTLLSPNLTRAFQLKRYPDTDRHEHHKREGKDAGPLMLGFFEIVRYPNYLAEITFWTVLASLSAALIKRSGDLYDAVRPCRSS